MSAPRTLDKSQYDTKTLAIFRVIGSYFADVFYNHLYDQAKSMKNSGSYSSITSGYKEALQRWDKALNDQDFYKKTIKDMHRWMLNYTIYTTDTLSQCIDRISAEFAFSDYFSSYTNKQKEETLKRVIKSVNKTLIQKIVNEYLGLIIDDRNQDNAKLLTDSVIDILLWEKEYWYKKAIALQTKTPSSTQVGGWDMRTQYEADIKQLISEKIELKKGIENRNKIIIEKVKIIEQLQEQMRELQSEMSDLRQITPLEYNAQNQVLEPQNLPEIKPKIVEIIDEPDEEFEPKDEVKSEIKKEKKKRIAKSRSTKSKVPKTEIGSETNPEPILESNVVSNSESNEAQPSLNEQLEPEITSPQEVQNDELASVTTDNTPISEPPIKKSRSKSKSSAKKRVSKKINDPSSSASDSNSNADHDDQNLIVDMGSAMGISDIYG